MNHFEYKRKLKDSIQPLSVLYFMDLAEKFLNEVYSSIDEIVEVNSKQVKKESDIIMVNVLAFKLKIGLSTVQYMLGQVPKDEMLNSVDDFSDYITSAVDHPEIRKALGYTIPNMLEQMHKMIDDREQIVAFEKENFSGIFHREDAEEKRIEETLRKIMQADENLDASDLNLKRGESDVKQVGVTPDGSRIMRTAVYLPFDVGTPVVANGVRGIVAGYFIEELKEGITPESNVLIEYVSGRDDFKEFDVRSCEHFSHPENLNSSSKFYKVLITDTKRFLM